jgi:hypothetical protein
MKGACQMVAKAQCGDHKTLQMPIEANTEYLVATSTTPKRALTIAIRIEPVDARSNLTAIETGWLGHNQAHHLIEIK